MKADSANESELEYPDISHIVIEDDTPVDSFFAEKQQRLLTESLYTSWAGPKSGIFMAVANVGLFFDLKQPPLVPDMMLSLDVTPGADVRKNKKRNSYFMFEYKKPPEVVIEIVSGKDGNEMGSKLETYARIGIAYYVVFDPELFLLDQPLRIMVLRVSKYAAFKGNIFNKVGLGLTLWEGEYETMPRRWLRWTDAKGALIPTGFERAEEAHQRAERLAAKLRELGKNPGE